MSSSDIYQQVYGVSMASNALTNERGKTLEQLQKQAEGDIPSLLDENGGWKLVWGPVVYMDPTNTDGAPDNVWCVAHKPNATFSNGRQEDVYVVGIAGTATFSQFDAMVEDFEIDKVVDLDAWIKSGLLAKPSATDKHKVDDKKHTYISLGIAIGINILLNTKVPATGTAIGPNTTLEDFFATIPNTSNLIFTGHSLGGALSPALAVAWLSSTMTKRISSSNVYVYPTAGPSPWNENFVKLFQFTFDVPSGSDLTGHKRWNTNIVNSEDAVPKAWCTKPWVESVQNLHKIPHLNNACGIDFASLSIAVGLKLVPAADKSGIVYRPLKSSTFMGSGTPPYPRPDDPMPSDGQPFLPQWSADALYQHMDQYHLEFGYAKKSEAARRLPTATYNPETVQLMAARMPVISALASAVNHPGFKAEVDMKQAEMK